jgi:hypothetical protein
MEPIVNPKQSGISITHNCVHGHGKESFDWFFE